MSDELTKVVVDLSKPKGHPERELTIALTPEEILDLQAMQKVAELAEAERLALETAKAEAKAAAKSKLEALGLTPEEIAAITGA